MNKEQIKQDSLQRVIEAEKAIYQRLGDMVNERDTFLAMPVGTGWIPHETVDSMMSLRGVRTHSFIGNALVYDARDMLVEQFLKSDCRWLFFMDSDMVLSPLTIPLLKEVNKPLVTAMAFKRKAPFEPCFFVKVVDDAEDGVPKLLFPLKWSMGLVPIVACGMAACLIRRDAVEATVKKYPRPFSPNGKYGEDVLFCLRAREAGVTEMYCHTGVDSGHLSRIPVTSSDFSSYVENHKDEYVVLETIQP